jgi:hypothetical protein
LRLSLAGAVILALLAGLGGLVLAQTDEERGGAFTMRVVDVTDVGDVIEASEPRLSGTWIQLRTCNALGDSRVCVSSVRLENEGGTWLGRQESIWASSYKADRTVLEGQGDYAGLTAILDTGQAFLEDPDRDGQGVVFEGDVPPMPELPEPTTE